MDTLLTVVGLLVLAAWAVLWVVATGALMANEPKPDQRRRGQTRPGSFRPADHSQPRFR